MKYYAVYIRSGFGVKAILKTYDSTRASDFVEVGLEHFPSFVIDITSVPEFVSSLEMHPDAAAIRANMEAYAAVLGGPIRSSHLVIDGELSPDGEQQ